MPETTVPSRLLLVDRDVSTRDLVASICAREGYELRVATEPAEVRQLLVAWQPHVLLLDLPDLGTPGVDLSGSADGPAIPALIVITAHNTPTAVRSAYAAGAEDFVRKPFDPDELTYRLKIALQTLEPAAGAHDDGSPFSIGLWEGRLTLSLPHGRSTGLTPLEARLMRRFLLTPGVPVPRDELMRAGWGRDLPTDHNALEVSVRRLRRKIEYDPHHPRFLVTARGLGYTLRTAAAAE